MTREHTGSIIQVFSPTTAREIGLFNFILSFIAFSTMDHLPYRDLIVLMREQFFYGDRI